MVASTKSVRYLGVDLDQSLDGNYIAEIFLRKATHDSNSYGDMQNF